MKNKLTYILFALFTLLPFTASARTIYCKMQYSWWYVDGAAVGVHYWGGSSSTSWPGVRMTQVAGESNVWQYDVPDNTVNVIFVRVNSSGTIADWGAQTGDLTLASDKNFYTINTSTATWSGSGGKCSGTWSAPTATGVTLDESSLTLEAGTNRALTATVAPVYTFDKTITWTSSNTDVATVNVNGEVHAVAAGEVTITAKTTNGKTATCTVTVTAPAKKYVTSITFTNDKRTITKGFTSQITGIEVLPADADDKSYTLSSDDTDIVTVSKSSEGNYYINAIAPGTTTIRATANDGSGTYGTSVVRVDDRLRTFTINFYTEWTTPYIHIWDSENITATTWPGNALTSLADSKGEGWWKYDFVKAEESTAKFIFNDGVGGDKKQTTDLTVEEYHTAGDYYMNAGGTLSPFIHATSFTLSHTSLTLKTTDAAVQLTATVEPANASFNTVTWSSDKPAFVGVSSLGKVTAKASGVATITASTQNGAKVATCIVTVPSTAVTIEGATELSVVEGREIDIPTATANGPEATVVWTSTDERIAKIENGKIVGVAVGTTTLTATASDNTDVTATCTVTVTASNVPSTKVTISSTAELLKPNGTVTLTAHADGTNTDVTWSSDNEDVATVANGVVTAHTVGTAVITATSVANPAVSASCTITVKEAQVLYLNTGGSVLWSTASPRFAAYFFDNTAKKNTWVDMTQIAAATPNVYTVEVPMEHNYPNVIFVRMNPANTENRWNTTNEGTNKPVWDQTGDLTFSETENFYHITSWGYDNKATGYWNTYTDGATGEQATAQYNESAVQKNDPRVMLQACYWKSFLADSPYGQSNWSLLNEQAGVLGTTFDLIWLPPSAKSADRHGYLPIDYSDQNGYWGSVTELKTLIGNLNKGGAQVVADIVMNHVAGQTTCCDLAQQDFGNYGVYNPTMKWICSSDESGSGGGASDTGMDCDDLTNEKNYDAARDWDHTNPIVQSMMISYLKWLQKEIGYAGWRYDFGKGVAGKYIEQYNRASETNFSVMEYFDGDTETLINYLITTNHNTMVFDFGTKFRVFNEAIQKGNYQDIPLEGLIARNENGVPYKRYSVTFVDSHDTFYRPDNSDMEFMEYGNSMKPANKNKVLEANVFLLSMPGVPCVAYPHWHAYSTELIPMIQARKDAGVHSESAVTDEAGSGYYKATITGTNGSLKIFLGPNSGYNTRPEGYALVAKGTNYGMYCKATDIPVRSITLDKTAVSLLPGDNVTLTANVLPAYAADKTLTWTTDNDEVATVVDGVVTAVADGTATITATTTNGLTATCAITVAETTNVPIYFEVSGTGWGEIINAHAWCTDNYDKTIPATKLDIPHATKTWYKAEIPVVTGKVVNVQARNGVGNEFADYSAKIENFTAESAYVINSTVDSEGHRTVTASDELSLTRKFVYSKVGEYHYYSNRITTENGTVSYFTGTDATDYIFGYGNDIQGYAEETLTNQASDGIYYATVTGTTVDAPAVYEGEYYLRSAVAPAGWDGAYKVDNKMKKITDYNTAGYVDVDQYYWVNFIEAPETGDINVKAAVANDYNDYLAEVTDYNINATTGGANVRYGYNPSTNTFTRAMMGGSITENFLTLYGTEADKIFMLKDAGLETESLVSVDATSGTSITFKDATDFKYSTEVYAIPGAKGVMKSHFHDMDTYLFAGLEENAKTLLAEGFEGGEEKDTYKHRLKIYYDFKTHRITSAWIPTAHVAEHTSIPRDLVITRSGSGAASTFTMADGASLTVDALEIELYIDKAEWKKNGGFFWFSLPFECPISSITGLSKYEYGTNKDWVVQRYRGDKRAADGGTQSTYWYNMKQTATLEANRGYVLYIASEKIFEEFGYTTIFFSPATTEDGVTLSSTATINAPEHKHEKADESNWNLIGVGTLQPMKASTWNTEAETRLGIQKYFYTWRWDETTKKGVYALANAEEHPMLPTQSYFVQHGGTIDMTPHSLSRAAAPLRAPAKTDIYAMRMDITHGEQTDKTYIILDETATEAYDLNLDLGKIINEGMPQIYTMCAASKLAANNLPTAENQSVGVGVKASAAGMYTFSMPQVANGVIPVLYDSETGDVVNLALDDYSTYLEAGTYETRFILRMNMPGIVTECEEVMADAEWQITQVGNELLLSGIDGDVDIRLYDALGRMLYQTNNAHEMISVPQTGVYVVQVNGVAQRVLVK